MNRRVLREAAKTVRMPEMIMATSDGRRGHAGWATRNSVATKGNGAVTTTAT